ncbi:hypothetical protein [Chryseolinea lacunae]|uniref:Uncharacterized protein n=1 Tax=Chryseolinea lacunae TaxID=2801331 RepID=A0ABS1L2A1_9BACT|nr:hypothetical protein [Chryseolinea lacunae]
MRPKIEKVIKTIRSATVVSVCHYKESETAINDITQRYREGQRVFEISRRSMNARRIFAELVQCRPQRFPDAVLGVGIILEAKSARFFLRAGADFLVSPITQLDIKKQCDQARILWIPHCFIAKDMVYASKLRCPVIKIFPDDVSGPNTVCNQFSVAPQVRILPNMPKGGSPTLRSFEHIVLSPAYAI